MNGRGWFTCTHYCRVITQHWRFVEVLRHPFALVPALFVVSPLRPLVESESECLVAWPFLLTTRCLRQRVCCCRISIQMQGVVTPPLQ